MEVIYEDAYLRILVDKTHSIISDEWKEASSQISSDEEFKASVIHLRIVNEQCAMAFTLTNALHLYYPVSPDLQQWIYENVVMDMKERGLKKQAFVMPKDIFAQASVTQYTDDALEATNHELPIKHFDSLEEAKKWLLS